MITWTEAGSNLNELDDGVVAGVVDGVFGSDLPSIARIKDSPRRGTARTGAGAAALARLAGESSTEPDVYARRCRAHARRRCPTPGRLCFMYDDARPLGRTSHDPMCARISAARDVASLAFHYFREKERELVVLCVMVTALSL